MALTTYTELTTAIKNWLHRADQDQNIPDFISLAEASFNRELRLEAMEDRAVATINTSDPTYGEYIALPDGFLEMRNLQLNTTPVSLLTYMSPEVMDVRYGGQVSRPKFYAIVGDQIQFSPRPDAGYEVEMAFYKKFDPLEGSNNWLFQNYPDVYLYGSLLAAAFMLKDDKAVARWEPPYLKVMGDINKADDRLKWSGSSLTMRAV